MEHLSYILLILFILILILFLFFLYKKLKQIKITKNNFKNNLLVNIGNLLINIELSIKYANELVIDRFPGANDVIKELIRFKTKINDEIIPSIKKQKRYKKILNISKNIDFITKSCNEIVNNLRINKTIDVNIRKNLENEITSVENKILKAIGEAKNIINNINKENPQSIWRGFNYKDIDRRIEFFINKSKQLAKNSINELDMYNFEKAHILSKDSLKNINNAYVLIQSIFDIQKQLNISKQNYYKYISYIPKLMNDIENIVSKQNVNLNIKNIVDKIKKQHKELISEINKEDDKNIDWILINSLLMSIINEYKHLIKISNKNIVDYEKQEKEKK